MSTIERLMRWIPALVMMTAIFMLSALPASKLPTFGPYDVYVKKISHAIGYGLLGVSYYYALPTRLPRLVRWSMAFGLSLGFAVSDEFHQSYVDGRTASVRDVAIDAMGAFLALFLAAGYSSSIIPGSRAKSLPNSTPD
ncbi:MAG: VanZ family protein [Anaerolineales bacterium]